MGQRLVKIMAKLIINKYYEVNRGDKGIVRGQLVDSGNNDGVQALAVWRDGKPTGGKMYLDWTKVKAKRVLKKSL